MSSETTDAVVLLSGGIDSSTLLHHVVKEQKRQPVYAISFAYGQRHVRELECARYQAAAVGVAAHHVVDLSFVGPLVADGTALVEGGVEVPDFQDLDESELDQPATYVPNRNMMLLSIAAAYAESQGAGEVWYGAQARDEYGYWDCTAEFLERINHLLDLNRRTPVRVVAPFVTASKADTVELGLKLGVDFSRTWSCYRGGEKACGTCPTCYERKLAFEQAGASDPVEYQD